MHFKWCWFHIFHWERTEKEQRVKLWLIKTQCKNTNSIYASFISCLAAFWIIWTQFIHSQALPQGEKELVFCILFFFSLKKKSRFYFIFDLDICINFIAHTRPLSFSWLQALVQITILHFILFFSNPFHLDVWHNRKIKDLSLLHHDLIEWLWFLLNIPVT